MRLALPLLSFALLAAGPALSQPAQAGGPALSADAGAVADCSLDLLPGELGACLGQISGPCLDGLKDWTLAGALACWQREEAAWAEWSRVEGIETRARLAMSDPAAPAAIDRAEEAFRRWMEGACALHRLAWPGDDNGPLLEAQCRMARSAEWAFQLYLLGRP